LALASNQVLHLADHHFQLTSAEPGLRAGQPFSAVLAVGCWAGC
jgi:hypothetical protein